MLMIGNKERKISLRLDVELADGLQAFANRERVPLSQVLRHLVIRFLAAPAAAECAISAKPQEVQASRPVYTGRAKRSDSEVKQSADNALAEFRKRVLLLFDGFRDQGLDMKEAVKRSNFALKAEKHPWATYEVIADIIRKTGRFRKTK